MSAVYVARAKLSSAVAVSVLATAQVLTLVWDLREESRKLRIVVSALSGQEGIPGLSQGRRGRRWLSRGKAGWFWARVSLSTQENVSSGLKGVYFATVWT